MFLKLHLFLESLIIRGRHTAEQAMRKSTVGGINFPNPSEKKLDLIQIRRTSPLKWQHCILMEAEPGKRLFSSLEYLTLLMSSERTWHTQVGRSQHSPYVTSLSVDRQGPTLSSWVHRVC